MYIHLKIIGVLLVALSLVHAVFPGYFDWKKELSSLSLINRQIMMVHTFFIALTVLFIGLLCLTSSAELIDTGLGRRICLGLSLFWGTRLIIQFIGYSPKLWKGKVFETSVHIVFAFLWGYLTLIFGMIGIR